MAGFLDSSGFVTRDGTRQMTADWNMGDVNIGIGISPVQKFEIGSTDNSNRISIYHDNTDAYFKTDDGSFIFQTDEGTNTNTYLVIKGKGAGRGFLEIYDQGGSTEFLEIQCSAGQGELCVRGTSPVGYRMQKDGACPVNYFDGSSSGTTQYISISGYKTGDALRQARIGISSAYNNTLAFTNVGNYLFSGNVGIGVTPAQKFEIGSTDNSDRISIYHDNTDAYFKFDDGDLYLMTDEGTDTPTTVHIKPKGSAISTLQIHAGSEYLEFTHGEGEAFISHKGTYPGDLNLQHLAEGNVVLFQTAGIGDTKYLEIFGYATNKDSIQIGVGLDTDKVASFKGCAGGYLFDNKIAFTQIDMNEYIDSLNDGYMDYDATTGHRIRIGGVEELSIASDRVTVAGDLYITGAGSPTQNYSIEADDLELYILSHDNGYSAQVNVKPSLLDGTRGAFIKLYSYESGLDDEYLQIGHSKANGYAELSSRKSNSGVLQPIHIFCGTTYTSQLVINNDGTIDTESDFRVGTILFVNETANAKMTNGVTVMNTANDEMFTGKNGIAHGVTDVTETDTAWYIKEASVRGGIRIEGLTDLDNNDPGIHLVGTIHGNGVTEQAVLIDGQKNYGTGVTTLDATTRILVIRNGTGEKFIFKAGGDLDIVGDCQARQLIADGDNAGIASTISLTNVTAAADSNTPTHINTPTGVAAAQAVWVKVYVGTTPTYLPGWQ